MGGPGGCPDGPDGPDDPKCGGVGGGAGGGVGGGGSAGGAGGAGGPAMNVQGMTSLRMRRYGALRAGMDRARRLARAPWAAFPTTVGLSRLLPGPAYARLGRL